MGPLIVLTEMLTVVPLIGGAVEGMHLGSYVGGLLLVVRSMAKQTAGGGTGGGSSSLSRARKVLQPIKEWNLAGHGGDGPTAVMGEECKSMSLSDGAAVAEEAWRQGEEGQG